LLFQQFIFSFGDANRLNVQNALKIQAICALQYPGEI